MAVNLHEKYEKKIQSVFKEASLLTGRLSSDFSFKGAKTVKLTIPQTVPMVDYVRTGANRYGDPQEMQDLVQEMTLSQDKAFSLTLDKGNNLEQGGVKEAGRMLGLQVRERAVPTSDTYGFSKLAERAGKIVGNAEALTKSNVCARISEGTLALDDAEIPQDGRTLFVPAAVYKLLKHSDEFLGVESLGEKALAKGQVGLYDNMTVVKVPSGRWPANVNFIIVQKQCAAFPVTLSETKLHRDPPGISGNLLEGRQIYDLFVFAPRAQGIYVEVDTGSGKGTVCAAPSVSSAGAFSCGTTGVSYSYTTGGSDPRYSASARVGTTSDLTAEGTVISVYAFKSGAYPSAVTTYTMA